MNALRRRARPFPPLHAALLLALLALGPRLASQDAPAPHAPPTAPPVSAPDAPAPGAEAPDGAPAAGPDEPPPDLSAVLSLSELDEGGPRGLRLREPEASPGYTLFEPLNSRAIYLVDLDGEIVHQWATDSSPGGWVYLQDDGSLLRGGRVDDDVHFKGGGIGGRLQRLAPDGTLLWNWRLADEQRHHHHDLERLPNGNILVIAWERVAPRDALKLGLDPQRIDREQGVWPDMLLEVRPLPPDDAEIVWEWHARDHLVQDRDSRSANFGDPAEHPGRIDVNFPDFRKDDDSAEARAAQAAVEEQMRALGYVGGDDEQDDEEEDDDDTVTDFLHTNAVAYHPEYELIALSSPHLSEVFVIDHSTTTAGAAGSTGGRWGRGGDLLWRWGNPRNYGHGGPADRAFTYQHDPRWIPGSHPGELRLLVFNNGRERPSGESFSSVDELVLPFDPERGFTRAPGEPFGPSEPAWSYSAGSDFYSGFISGAQRLPNGNTLICSGAPGRIFEVTPAGKVVWDYRNGFGGDVDPPEHAGRAPPLALFRAHRYAPEHPGIRALLGDDG